MSHIGQGRAGLRRRRPAPINQTIIPPSELSQKIPGETKIETRKTNHVNFSDPTHSVNNTDEGMTIQFQLKDPLPHQLDPTYIEVKRVHKVQIVQGTQILTQILI